jgi:GNAT superfamily N-acetyltransferase
VTAFVVRLAVPDGLPLVMEIVAEATAWLTAKGIDQWPSPPNVHWERRMAMAIERREVFTAGFTATRFAIVRLTWSDEYWPDDGRAGYVHTMAIRDALHGQGIGKAILEWTTSETRQQGKSRLRLDCLAGSGRLRRYYENQGFVYQGEFTDRDYVAALYELALLPNRDHMIDY